MPTASGPDGSVVSLAEQLLALCADLPEAVLSVGSDWRFEYLNNAALIMLALDADVIGSDARTVRAESFLTPFGAAYRRVMETRLAETLEHHHGPLDRYIRGRILPLTGGGILITLADITGYRKPQAELAETLELNEQLLDHMTQSMTLRDLDSRYLLVNRAAATSLGLLKSELVGRTPEEVFTPTIAAAIRATDLVVQRTGRIEESPAVHALHPDRLVFPRVFPVRDANGTTIGCGTTMTDVTELASLRAGLAASHDRFRRVFGRTSLGILLTTIDGQVLEANSALSRLLGYSQAQLTTMSDLDLVSLSVEAGVRQRQRIADEGDDGYEIEEEFVRSDGKTVPVLLTINTFFDPLRSERVASIVVRDLTEVRALNTQLVAAERMEAVGRLAAGIVHDTNNVLAAVGGYVELLTESIGENPLARRQLGGISRSLRRAEEMVGRLMTVSSGRPRAPRRVDLSELVHDLEDMLRRLLPPEIELLLQAQPAATLGDSSQLQQVVLNLVVNARNAMTAGTIRIATSSGPGPTVTLTVTDDGPGMSKDVADRCFDPFFSTRASSGGTGLGLSTALSIAQQNGGNLRVRTSPGAGSTFELRLPAADEGEQPRSAARRAPGRILVADDDDDVRSLLVATLQGAGYAVTAVPDGAQALPAAAAVDLVISDIEMPHVGGLELREQLATARPDLPVILISGAAAELPSGPFLAKPFTQAALLRAVQTALRATP